MTRGKRVRLLRIAKDVGSGELAKRAGIALNTLSNIERDVYEGRHSTLDAVADALGVRRDAIEDDRSCLAEIARVVGVALPVEPSPDAELAQLVAGVQPDRRAAIVSLVRSMVGAFGLPPLPPGATVVQNIERAAEIHRLEERAKRRK